jgi:dipeptidyl aminopeptidase/acylaminoacyl peptidase
MELADLGREVGLSSPAISPDGSRVAVIKSNANFEENRFDRSLLLIEVTNRTERLLTPGRRRVSSPQWSPSGDRLAFLDTVDEGEAQIYVIPMTAGEAKRVTNVERGVRSYAWRPDGEALAFTTTDAAEEREGEERHNKSFEVGDNVYLAQSAPTSTHIWLVAADGGEPERLTSGEWSVTGFVWAPDGRAVAYARQPRPHTGEELNGALAVLDLTTGGEREVYRGATAFGAGSARFSPDGALLAFGRSSGNEPFFHPSHVAVISPSGGEPRVATGDIDRSLRGEWLPSGELLVWGPDLTRVSVWIQPLEGSPRRVDLGAVDPISSFAVSTTGAVAFIGEEPGRPQEVYHMGSLSAAPQRLTDVNGSIAGLTLGRVETVEWDGPDGFRENGVVTYPPGFTDGQRYPLVLYIHGGPMGTSTEGWDPFAQLLAAQDWIVFRPNYRGSSNMGDEFQSAVINDAGEGPGRDVMAGVEALKKRGIVDESRMAVSGWSYGGYMTVWLTSHYDGWRAAMAGAAVTDWFDWYNLADYNVWAGYGLGGSPWLNDNAENYWRQSPIAYAHQIRTPTLILSTTGDPRVTVTQSYKLYHALKDNGVPVKFIAYPVGGHFPPDPVHRRDVYRRWVDWIEEHFREMGTTN